MRPSSLHVRHEAVLDNAINYSADETRYMKRFQDKVHQIIELLLIRHVDIPYLHNKKTRLYPNRYRFVATKGILTVAN